MSDAPLETYDRFSDYQPVIVTPVLRVNTDNGWRVIVATHPPRIVVDGVSEAEAIEAQEAERAIINKMNG